MNDYKDYLDGLPHILHLSLAGRTEPLSIVTSRDEALRIQERLQRPSANDPEFLVIQASHGQILYVRRRRFAHCVIDWDSAEVQDHVEAAEQEKDDASIHWYLVDEGIPTIEPDYCDPATVAGIKLALESYSRHSPDSISYVDGEDRTVLINVEYLAAVRIPRKPEENGSGATPR